MKTQTAANVSELARETIRLLASRRLAPTPENYSDIYAELSGQAGNADPARLMLEKLAERLWMDPAQRWLGDRLSRAVASRRWKEVDGLLHDGLTGKGDGAPGDDAAAAASAGVAPEDAPAVPASVAAAAEADAVASAAGDQAIWSGLLADTLEQALADRLQYVPDLQRQVMEVSRSLRSGQITMTPDEAGWRQELEHILSDTRVSTETTDQLFRGSFTLLQLIVEHIATLSSEDRLVQKHVNRVGTILGDNPSPDALRNAEQTLREFLFRQDRLRSTFEEAKGQLKRMVTMFIERLGTLSDNTGEFSSRMGEYSRKIGEVDDIDGLSHIIGELENDSRSMQVNMNATREELDSAKQQVNEYENRVQRLEQEIELISELVKEDQLTGALNRRGLDQVFAVETSRCARSGVPFSVALLDIDNFKSLNDRLGHKAGDDALRHLATVVRALVRPTDSVARYGGEEFVILLPETGMDDGKLVMERLQRELTKRFYLHNNEKVFITFSGGVSQWTPGESRDSVIERADQAMYKAKKAGKNRVELAEPMAATPPDRA